ncbi:ParA family protein [Mycolicibacterium vanbaalenii]|uniref:ParA family protein n=1 Tax=Mycolicibacterium vanbaalenii TaxID=110539 RepID=UPI001F28F146|nr:ParA family protein [Mycolicibacterium vanbaalenii]
MSGGVAESMTTTSVIDAEISPIDLALERLRYPFGRDDDEDSDWGDSLLSSTPEPVLRQALSNLIVTVAAWKGGVGKTEISKEIAWILGAVLVDFDWDRGNATRAWGYRYETRTNAPLLDAFETGRTPRPLKGGEFRADLVPSHPDWMANQPEDEVITRHIEQWSAEWRRPVVIDTHPGGGDSTYGAVAAAHVIVTPVELEVRALEALEGQVEELRAYPLLIVPNVVAAAPKKRVDHLERISKTYDIPVLPPISKYPWLAQRQYRMAVSARKPVPARSRPFVQEVTAVARAVVELAITRSAGESE